MSNVQSVKETIVLTASYYGVQIRPEVLQMYAEDLADLPALEVIKAYQTYRRNSKNRAMPLPAQIRDIVEPEVNPESAAREIAARISAAVPKFGYSNRSDAEKYIGPIGWGIVQRQGGWQYLCEHIGVTIDPTTLQAQVREMAKAEVTYGSSRLNEAIGIGTKEKPQLTGDPGVRGLLFGIGKEMP